MPEDSTNKAPIKAILILFALLLSDGENVSMTVKSLWTPQGGRQSNKERDYRIA
jgi:hypothetical protein